MRLGIRAGAAFALLGWTAALAGQPQLRITRVESMPNIPQPFGVRDWRAVARGFDRLAFDLKATGEHLPLVWLVRGADGGEPVTFGLPSYVGGYGFTMNTFVMAWPLVPLVRYDARFARAIGKWMLNAASAARLLYPGAHPPGRQSCPGWKGDPNNVIAYEGLMHKWRRDEQLQAGGDPVVHRWGPKTDLGVYGSAYVGIFGGIISRTDNAKILQLDLLATDFYRDKAYPTHLYFNPHKVPVTIHVDLGAARRDLYDCVSGRFFARKAAGSTPLTIPADGAVVCVRVPAGGKPARRGRKLLVGGVVVDYRAK